MTRINIFYEFKDSPWGGGNQFLKSLKKYLQSADVYEPVPEKADVILFNSHQSVAEVASFKLKCPNKLFVHRIDGPMRLYNKMSDKRDDIVFVANKYLTDATIFQSNWSRQQNHLLGLPQHGFETVIVNAPEPTVFNHEGKIPFSTERKIKLIATSWSSNWKKGFDVYQWLDENLDFNKYQMLFVGKSPVRFKNIKIIPPLSSKDVAERLKESDIFIFASSIEACSNSLLEALHCGLPAIGPHQSSTPEIIGRGGETFSKPDEIPFLIEKITTDYYGYQANIKNPSMEEVGKRYYDFITEVLASKQIMNSYGWMVYARVKAEILKWRFSERIGNLVGRTAE
jgi:glycosyltransferase involved in cell wall biosynthesis